MSSPNQPVQSSGNHAADDLRIESWKEIAAFFGRDQRTVKRWEKTRNLPVRRLPGENGGVFAYARELTEWLNSAVRLNGNSGSANPASGETPGSPEATSIPLESPRPVAASPSESPHTHSAVTRKRLNAIGIIAPLSGAAFVILCTLSLGVYLHRQTAANANSVSRLPVRYSPAAQELYLQGRFAWNHRTARSIREAMDSFNQAIARDPSFAPAYAGIADCYNLMPQYSGASPSEVFPRAISAARKSLALDSTLPEAHRALAFGLFYGEWNVNAAFREYRRAIELAPADAETHSWFATSLLLLGRTADAAAEIARARELNPTSRSILANQAFILYNSGDRAAGIEKLKSLEAEEPDYLGPSGYLAQIFLGERSYAAYTAELKHIAEVSGEPDQWSLASAAERGWSASGERGLLEQLRSIYLEKFRAGKSSGFDLALVDTRLGLHQEADQYFQAAIDSRDYRAISLLNGDFDAVMKGDPDFLTIKQQIRARMQLY